MWLVLHADEWRKPRCLKKRKRIGEITMSEDETLPQRKPRTIRSAVDWLMAHPEWSVPAGTFLLGVAVGLLLG